MFTRRSVAAAAPPPYTGGPRLLIVGGDRVTDPIPWVVAISTPLGFRCGGVLITPSAVVTAAPCLGNPPPDPQHPDGAPPTEDATVHVGSLDNRRGPDGKGAELAVLILDQPVPNQPAHLDPARPDLPVRLTGWGYTKASPLPGADLPEDLRSTDARVVNPAQCTNAAIGPDELCLASAPGEGPCDGDSGSAGEQTIGQRTVVVSLTSRGIDGVACGAGPAIAVDLGQYRQWIYHTALRGALDRLTRGLGSPQAATLRLPWKTAPPHGTTA